MSQLGNITLVDNTVTPSVDHIFEGVQGGSNTIYRNFITNTPLGAMPTIALSEPRRKRGDPLRRVKATIVVPQLETAVATGNAGYLASPKVAFAQRVNIEFILHDRGRQIDNQLLINYSLGLLYSAPIADAVTKGIFPQ
jgi:hypothetical protein